MSGPFRRKFEEEAASALLLAEAALRMTGEAAETARVEAIRQLVRVPFDVAPRQRAEALLALARAVYFSGARLLTAVEPAALGVALLRSLDGDSEALARALMLQGAILAAVLNANDAIDCNLEAFDIGARLSAPKLQSMAASNIGAVFYQLARYEQSLRLYEVALRYAVEEARISPDDARQRRAAALSNAARCHYHLGRYSDGLLAVEEALGLMSAAEDVQAVLARSLTESLYATLLVAAGRAAEAESHARLALAQAASIGAAAAVLEAECALGVCEMVLKNAADIGLSRIGVALERSRQMPPTFRNMLLTASLAAERSGDASSALSYQRMFALETRKAHRTAQVQQRVQSVLLQDDGGADAAPFLLEEHAARLKATLARQLGSESRLVTLAMQAEAPIDPDGLHCFRMAKLCELLALALGRSQQEAAEYAKGGLLHDIGMIAVPRSTQMKGEQLDEQERMFITQHPIEGTTLLAAAPLEHSATVEEAVRNHHERYDGYGYPDGLRGAQIPEVARVVALADAFDAMTHPRPYAAARTVEEALEEIERWLGLQFDPVIGATFIDLIKRLRAEHGDVEAYLAASAAHLPIAHAGRRLLGGNGAGGVA
jgi:putative two-component system response regulator